MKENLHLLPTPPGQNQKKKQVPSITLPETHIFAPENGGLGSMKFPFGFRPIFRGENVSFREDILDKNGWNQISTGTCFFPNTIPTSAVASSVAVAGARPPEEGVLGGFGMLQETLPPTKTNMAMENSNHLEMYLLFKTVIFQPAMLVRWSTVPPEVFGVPYFS